MSDAKEVALADREVFQCPWATTAVMKAEVASHQNFQLPEETLALNKEETAGRGHSRRLKAKSGVK
jgi:hypothetical protein